jgi:hypothetical protein
MTSCTLFLVIRMPKKTVTCFKFPLVIIQLGSAVNTWLYVRFEVFTSVTTKNVVYWDVM